MSGKGILLASKGIIRIYKGENFEEIGKFHSGYGTIVAIKADNLNGLVVIGCEEGYVCICRGVSMEKLREVWIRKPIRIVELSVFHGLFITSDMNN